MIQWSAFAEGLHRIGESGAERGAKDGDERRNSESRGGAGQDGRVGWLHAEAAVIDELLRGPPCGGGSDDAAGNGDGEALTDDVAEDVAGRGSKGHADPDFLAAACGGIGRDAVETDHAKQQREEAEGSAEPREEALAAEGRGDLAVVQRLTPGNRWPGE